MRCPTCGSPVQIRGSRWECGWCCDFGDLPRKYSAPISLKIRVQQQSNVSQSAEKQNVKNDEPDGYAPEETEQPAALSVSEPYRADPVPVTDDIADDGTVFRFCSVKIDGVRRPYAYLVGTLPLQVGDWVEVPFGAENATRCGQVVSISECTRTMAPWPPEKTKQVLRRLDAPKAQTEPSASKEAPLSKAEITPEPTPSPVAEAPTESPPSIENPAAKKANTAPRRPYSPAAVGVLLAVLLFLAFCAVQYWRIDTRYQQAQADLAARDFSAAVEECAQIPPFFKEQKLLVGCARSGLLAQGGTAEEQERALHDLQSLLFRYETAAPEEYALAETYYKDLLYETAIFHLLAGQYETAWERLQKVPKYPCAAELLSFAKAGKEADGAERAAQLRKARNILEKVPADYAGPCAAELTAFRAQLNERIAQAEEREEAERIAEEERIAALKRSGIPYVGMAESEVNATRQLGKAYRSDIHTE